MSTLDILYLSLAAGFLFFVAVITYLVYNIVGTIKVMRSILYDISDTTSDVRSLKNQVKWGILGFISAMMKRR